MTIPPSENHDAAVSLKCPRCGASPGFACESFRGGILTTPHAERFSLAAGGTGKVTVEHPGYRQFQQSYADPEARANRHQQFRTKYRRP
jgi:hypothetical protein